MNIDLSICIPTLNRPEYLLKALNSIFNQERTSMKIEVCISNNYSESDYSKVEKFIENDLRKKFNVKYFVQQNKLSLDEHMHYVTKMANGEYIYYLGDDDYFKEDAFKVLSRLIKIEKVDLSIFDALMVDSNDNILRKSFNNSPMFFSKISDAFLQLKGNSTFGAVLIKSKFINNDFFCSLYGGSHAYTNFWISMLNNIDDTYKIVVPKEHVVYLRMAKKNYNISKVYYVDIPLHHAKFRALINNEIGRKLIDIRTDVIKKYSSSLKFKVTLILQGNKYNVLPVNSVKDRLVNISSLVIAYNLIFIKKFKV